MSSHLNQYTVAIVGATGLLGREFTKVFLTEYSSSFSRVIAVVRDVSSPKAKLLAEQGAELRQISTSSSGVYSFIQAFDGVDVVINTCGTVPEGYRDAVLEGILKSSVKVYFTSDFGCDLRLNDFPGWDNLLWLSKVEHCEKARKLADGKVKVITVANGLFFETAFAPWFGFDTANLTYTCLGSPDTKLAFTGTPDIGRAVAVLSLLALSPDSSSRVPDYVRIVGEHLSYREVRDIVQRIRDKAGVEPRGEIALKSEDLEEFKKKVREQYLKEPPTLPTAHIRLHAGEGKLIFSENDNELVNPGQKGWKWKSVEEYINDIGGKPFC